MSCHLSFRLTSGDQQLPSPHPQHTESLSSCRRHPWAGWQPMCCFCAAQPRGTRGTGEGQSPHNLQGNRGRTSTAIDTRRRCARKCMHAAHMHLHGCMLTLRRSHHVSWYWHALLATSGCCATHHRTQNRLSACKRWSCCPAVAKGTPQVGHEAVTHSIMSWASLPHARQWTLHSSRPCLHSKSSDLRASEEAGGARRPC